jgi:hypothetical protein
VPSRKDASRAHTARPPALCLDRSVQSHLVRLRLGILLIVLSWFPFAEILITVLRDHGHLSSDNSATRLRLVIWGIQIVVGLVGVLLVGKVTVREARRTGWRRTPAHLWRLFWRGWEPL